MIIFKTNSEQLLEIAKKRKEKKRNITKLMNTIINIDTTDLSSKESLERIVQEYTRILDSI